MSEGLNPRRTHGGRSTIVRNFLVAAMLCVVWLSIFATHVRSAEPRRLLVYAPNTSYSVEVVDRKGTDYLSVVELLEPLGGVTARSEGKYWTLTFTNASRSTRTRFRDGKRDVELPGGKISLPNNFVLINDRGYVPLESLQNIVAQITGLQTQLHSASHHLYLGGVGTLMNVDLKPSPSRLVLNFSTPVAPQIRAEGNSLRLVFARDPVLGPATESQDFRDAVFQNATYSETATGAEYVIRASSPLVANSSDGGRTLTISATAPAATASTQPATAPPSQTTAPQAAANPANPAAPVAEAPHPAFLVMIDASHGGDEAGASLTPKLLEKDVTLALSRRIAHELQNRGIAVSLLRNSDVTLTPEQRANAANTSHAAVYIAVHASALGHGIRIFTSLMPPTPVVPEARRTFIPWDAAQSQFLDRSSAISGSIAFECDRRQLKVKALQGAVLPLNNIATAAVAIEVAPGEDGVESLASAEYVQSVATAIANGIAATQVHDGERKEGEKK